MIKIHKEGWGFLIKLFAFLLSVNISLFYLYSFPSFAIFFLFIISFLVFLFFLQFFRSPKIIKTIDEKLIVSPANGEVVHIGEVFEDEYYKEKKLLNNRNISFMPIFFKICVYIGSSSHLSIPKYLNFSLAASAINPNLVMQNFDDQLCTSY